MNKTIIDLNTGESRVVAMDEEEIAARAAEEVVYAERREAREAVIATEKLRRAATEALLDDLMVKRASEPDVPAAIEAYLRDKV